MGGAEIYMSNWPFVVYGGAALIALALLYFLRARAWYWHVLSLVVALTVGLIPIAPKYNTTQGTLVIGAVFVFFLLWGVAAPFFPANDRE
jgi:hypothetical protein